LIFEGEHRNQFYIFSLPSPLALTFRLFMKKSPSLFTIQLPYSSECRSGNESQIAFLLKACFASSYERLPDLESGLRSGSGSEPGQTRIESAPNSIHSCIHSISSSTSCYPSLDVLPLSNSRNLINSLNHPFQKITITNQSGGL
jgi:hypothetical protein